jgi:hypothetical protein
MRKLIFLSFIYISVLSCNNSGSKKNVTKDSTARVDSLVNLPEADDPVRDSTLLALTKDILAAFKNKQYDSLSLFIHPDEGLLFSPYGYVDTANNVVVKAETMKTWVDKKKQVKIFWGWFDANEEEIRMTMNEYVKRFVYDVDFLKPDSIKVDELIAGEHVLNQLRDFFPGCHFVESHFNGFEEKQEGMDWRNLRLVFKKKDGTYYLVGVIHDEWGI